MLISDDMKKIEIHTIKPIGFSLRLQAVACYIEVEERLLLLQRAAHKSEAGKWGVPGGKIEENETPRVAVLREVFEETGILLDPSKMMHYKPLYIRKPEFEYVFHLFKVQLDQMPSICLCDENVDYQWVTKKQLAEVPFMEGGEEILDEHVMRGFVTNAKEFYFIRHGQTDHNISIHLKEDHGDISLNETGRKQAKNIEPIVFSLPIQTVCSSPLKRAQETKEIISSRLQQVAHHQMGDFGECSSHVWREMGRHGMYSSVPKEGIVRSFIDRVHNGLKTALSLNSPILIVAHGGVHWALCSLLGIKEHSWNLENCGLVHFTFAKEGRWVARKLP
jgi:uncharacterized phosphatase